VSGAKQGIGDLDADRCRSVPLLSAGLDVVVLDARDRLGGRTVKREISGTGGEVIDMGWPVDRTDMALGRSASSPSGLDLYGTYGSSKHTVEFNGKLNREPGGR